MRHWRLMLVLLFGFVAVSIRDYLHEYIRVLVVIIIVGGAMWAAFNDSNYSHNKPKTNNEVKHESK